MGLGLHAPVGGNPTHVEWPDAVGNTFKAGDRVAIATVSGKSPQLVIGTVIQINRLNSKGQVITGSERQEVVLPDGSTTWQWVTVESCSVKVQPDARSRGFYSWAASQGRLPRPVTYHFPKNIVKLG